MEADDDDEIDKDGLRTNEEESNIDETAKYAISF